MENIMTKSQFKDNLELSIMYSGAFSYPSTETVKERIRIAKMLIEELKRKKSLRTVQDLQISNEELCEYSNQKISAILTALARNGNIEKKTINKTAYFSISSNNDNINVLENLMKFFETFYVENSNEIVDIANHKYEKKDH